MKAKLYAIKSKQTSDLKYLKVSRDQYACYKKYGNKLKSMTAEIGLIYTTKGKKTRLAGYLLKCKTW